MKCKTVFEKYNYEKSKNPSSKNLNSNETLNFCKEESSTGRMPLKVEAWDDHCSPGLIFFLNIYFLI